MSEPPASRTPRPPEATSEVLYRLAVAASSKRAEHLAARIESDIVRADWPVGEMLGTEPELLAKYDVSRSVFREAVRILEHHSVATMRRGPGGGLVVTAPDGDSFRRAAVLYLDYKNVSLAELFETRIALELLAVERAAREIDEDGIERLRAALIEDAEAAPPYSHGHGHTVHLVIAELSASPTIALFIDVLLSLTERQFGPAEAADGYLHLAESHRAHDAIVEAIVAGDAALARHRMRRHVESLGTFLDKHR